LLQLAACAPLLTISHLFWNNLFRRDNFTYFCQILPLLSTAGTISMCFDSFEKERFDASESIVLIPLPTRSMLLMISAHDSIAMYLAIEPQSLCFYVIAASKRKSEFSTEAGSKYLILGAFSSGILLFGCDRTTTDPFLFDFFLDWFVPLFSCLSRAIDLLPHSPALRLCLDLLRAKGGSYGPWSNSTTESRRGVK